MAEELSLEKRLIHAVRDKDAVEVKKLIDLKANVNYIYPRYHGSGNMKSVLEYACSTVCIDVVSTLVICGKANVNLVPDEERGTALEVMLSSWCERSPDENAVIEFLIDWSDDLNRRDTAGRTILWKLINSPFDNTKFLNLCIGKVDVNIRDNRGATALIYAVQLDRQKTVELLLQHGAQADIEDFEGKIALSYAFEQALQWKPRKVSVDHIIRTEDKQRIIDDAKAYNEEKTKEPFKLVDLLLMYVTPEQIQSSTTWFPPAQKIIMFHRRNFIRVRYL